MCSALFGVLPRVYLGLHYLSDVTAGAALGVGLVFMIGHFGPRTLANRWSVAWAERRPGLAYGLAFLMSFEVATLFEDIRQVGRGDSGRVEAVRPITPALAGPQQPSGC